MRDLSVSGSEPSLHDLIEDPVLQLLLKSDGITTATVVKTFDNAASHYQTTVALAA